MAPKRRSHVSQSQPRDKFGRFSRGAATTAAPSTRRASPILVSSSTSSASTTGGSSSTRSASTTAAPSSTRRASTRRNPSTTAGPSSTRRASTKAAPSSTRRASTTAGPSSTRRASTRCNPSATSESSSTRDESTTSDSSAAMYNLNGAGASSSRVRGYMDVRSNGAETKVRVQYPKMKVTMIYTDGSDNEGPLLRGKEIKGMFEDLRSVLKAKAKDKQGHP